VRSCGNGDIIVCYRRDGLVCLLSICVSPLTLLGWCVWEALQVLGGKTATRAEDTGHNIRIRAHNAIQPPQDDHYGPLTAVAK